MNILFKKYFWAVTLAALALMALVVAGGINDFIGAKLFAMPSPPSGSAQVDADSATPSWGRVAADTEAAVQLSERRIFNLDPDSGDEVEVEPKEEEEPEVEAPSPDDELEESQLALDLLGTLVAADAENSMATMSVEGENKIAWVGSEFLDGKATIAKIAPRHVVVKEDTKYTVVKLWDPKVASGAAKPGLRPGSARPNLKRPGAPTARPTPVTSRTPKTNPITDGIKKTGAYDYKIDRKMLDNQLKDLAKLQSEARVVPHYKNQKYEGFKLVGVRPGSLYRAIGIRSGDVVKAVNGNAIDSPTKAIQLFESLKNESNISVDIERRGQPKALKYDIQ